MEEFIDIVKAWSVIAWGGIVSFFNILDRWYPYINKMLALIIAVLTIIALCLRIRKDWKE